MHEPKGLPAASILLSTACIQCTLVYFFTLNSTPPNFYYPLMLLPYSLLLLVVNRLFLHQTRTMRDLVLLNGGLCLAAFASILVWGNVASGGAAVVAGAFCLWLTIRAGQLSLKAPPLLDLILNTDLSLVVLALFTAFLSVLNLPVSWCLPITIGCAASILGTIVFRSGSNLGAKSWVFLTVVFAGVFAMVWLLVSFVAAPAGEGLVTLWNWLVAAVFFLMKVIWKVVYYLLSLIPDSQGGALIAFSQFQPAEPMEEPDVSNPLLAMILLIALLLGAAVLAIFVLRRLGRLRLPAMGAQRGQAVNRRRVSLLAALRRLLASWGRWLDVQIWLHRNKNTPQGLYFLLVRRSKPMPWRKLRGETPREFVGRLAGQSAGDPELTQALEALIPAVDRALFAPDTVQQELPQAPLIRRRVGAAVRRGLYHKALSNLRGSLRRLHAGTARASER